MADVHILIFGEITEFKTVPFIAMKEKISANQNSPICMRITDIK